MRYFLLLPLVFLLAGCYQISSDEYIETRPTTNNPNLVPSIEQGPPSFL